MALETNTLEIEQGSLDWKRLRFGKFTGSCVGVLLQKGRGCEFSQKALDYMQEKVVERMVKQSVIDDDEQFELYLQRTNITNSNMRYGSEMEEIARLFYEKKNDVVVDTVGFYELTPYLGVSPDGYVKSNNTAIEFKCPTPKTHIKYLQEVKVADDLLNLDKNNSCYYAQAQLECVALNADYTSWSSFDYMANVELHTIKIHPDDAFINLLLDRIRIANDIVNERVETLNKMML